MILSIKASEEFLFINLFRGEMLHPLWAQSAMHGVDLEDFLDANSIYLLAFVCIFIRFFFFCFCFCF